MRDSTDCKDIGLNASIQYPGGTEVADNGIDEDCNGVDLYLKTNLFPNPFGQNLTVRFAYEEELNYQIIDIAGNLVVNEVTTPEFNEMKFDLPPLPAGVYLFVLRNSDGERLLAEKLVRQ